MFALTLWLIFGLVLKGLFRNKTEHLDFVAAKRNALIFNETTEQMFFTVIHSSRGKNFFLYIFSLYWIYEAILPSIFR